MDLVDEAGVQGGAVERGAPLEDEGSQARRFERTERIAPFLVDPEKVKQAEEQRAARLAATQKRRDRLTGD